MNRTKVLLAAFAAFALVAACGGRDDSNSSATTGAASSAAAATTAAATTAPAEAPEATDVGITATEIHIGVVADVDTPISPGLSQPLVDAVKAWGDQVNAAGGLAGRKVVVTFYDSKLNPDEATNAYTEACANEFATVGSGAFVLLNPAPIQECKDGTGAAIGLPDIAALSISPGAGQSKTTYAVIGAGQDYAAPTETYNVSTYGWDLIEKTLGAGVTPKLLAISPGVPGIGALIGATQQAATDRGWQAAGVVVFPDAAPQSEATPIAARIKAEGINVVASTSVGVAKIMAEARLQGVDVTKIFWTCTSQCQNPAFLQQGGDAVEGLYISQLLTPWTETDVPGVGAYNEGVAATSIGANGLAAYGAALSFQELVEGMVAKDGVNSLTRANVLALLATNPTVTAEGILADGTILNQPNPCWVTVQVQGGAFVRVDPEGVGKFNCDPAVNVKVVGHFE